MKIQEIKDFNHFINLAIASAKIRKIEIHQHKGKIIIRPQIHLMVSGERGTLKSTLLLKIAQHFKTHPYTDITEPALVGSISKQTMQFLEGASWQCRNSVLVLDEFEFVNSKRQTKGIVNLLLQLTEGNQYFKRKIAMFSGDVNEKDGDLFCKVKKGTIEVKTNFALIIGTMTSLNFRSEKLQALKSRCIAIEWKPDFDFMINVAKGEKIYEYENLLKTKKKMIPKKVIKKADYIVIYAYCVANITQKRDFLRRLLDCCRVYAIMGKHDYRRYNMILSDSSNE